MFLLFTLVFSKTLFKQEEKAPLSTCLSPCPSITIMNPVCLCQTFQKNHCLFKTLVYEMVTYRTNTIEVLRTLHMI